MKLVYTLTLLLIFADVTAQSNATGETLYSEPPRGNFIQGMLPCGRQHLFDWDTVNGAWIYRNTWNRTYNSANLVTSTLVEDTVANLFISRDTVVYDALNRNLLYESRVWNNGWENQRRYTTVFFDTTATSARIYCRYNGNGTSWILQSCDSTGNILDPGGNVIEYYRYVLDTISLLFDPSDKWLYNYDSLNRLIRREYFLYDTALFQYEAISLDSNYMYDSVFIDKPVHQIHYVYNNDTLVPDTKTESDYQQPAHTETRLSSYDTGSQQWVNFHKSIFWEICGDLDSSMYFSWLANAWVPWGGYQYLRDYQDSCNYLEFVIKSFFNHLGTYRNYIKYSCPGGILTATNEIMPLAGSVVSPNPFQNTAIITLNRSQEKDGFLRIYSSIGELVRQEKLSSLNKVRLERKNLPEGIYFYSISNLRHEVISCGKFVIQ